MLARFARGLRESPAVDQRSGVSARFAIAAAETVAGVGAAPGRPRGEDEAVARVGDLPAVLPTLRGKVEFERGEEGRESEVLAHLLRLAIAETFRDRLAGLDLSGFTDLFAEGAIVETGELVPAARAARPGRHGARAGQGARPARLGDAPRPARRPPPSSSCSRACT